MEEIFTKSIRLLKDVIYKEVNRLPSFLHIKSVFLDSWYNLIVPIVDAEDFSFTDSEKLIKDEKQKKVDMSYYIPEKYADEYQPLLEKRKLSKLGDDTYVTLSMKKKFEDVDGEFIEVTDKNFDEYVSMAEECFPDYKTDKMYCEHFYRLKSQNKDSDKIILNLLLKVGNKLVSFASIYGSKKQNLAYLHNAGTLKKYRKKGYYTNLLKYRCNLAFDNGIKNIYSIVEEGKGSYIALSKLGFTPITKFYLFS
jgi:N-acetylglutamate synthase-like GNAT family acetyltransferase